MTFNRKLIFAEEWTQGKHDVDVDDVDEVSCHSVAVSKWPLSNSQVETELQRTSDMIKIKMMMRKAGIESE
jgi:hypothetical protein